MPATFYLLVLMVSMWQYGVNIVCDAGLYKNGVKVTVVSQRVIYRGMEV
jgi:hypothetical protein